MTETTTLTLTDFLLRRIADDEYRARQAQGDQWPDLVDALGMYVNIPNRWHIAGWGPIRNPPSLPSGSITSTCGGRASSRYTTTMATRCESHRPATTR